MATGSVINKKLFENLYKKSCTPIPFNDGIKNVANVITGKINIVLKISRFLPRATNMKY